MDEKFNLDIIDSTFVRFAVGSKVVGQVVALTQDGYIVNIGGKKDGIIPYNDCEKLNEGDEIEAVIMSTHTDNGAILLSKRKADEIRKGSELVGNLKVGDNTEIVITNATNNGLVSKIGNVSVFVPASQVSSHRTDIRKYVGEKVSVQILEIDLSTNKIIASIRAYEKQERLTKEKAFWDSIYEGKIVKGMVSHFTDFGAFIKINDFDCLLHNSEASYESSKKASEILELNKEYEFKVIKVDKENKKVALSLKALQENPLIEKYKKYSIGDIVEAKVKKILPFGAILNIEDGVDGMLHIKEASAFYIKNIYEVAKVGEILKVKIIECIPEKMKISFSLKALQMDELSGYIVD